VRKSGWGLGLAAMALLVSQQTAAVAAASATTPAAASPAEVRVNQVGYAAGASKVAYVMLPAKVGSVAFTISGAHGVVLRGHSSDFAGGCTRPERTRSRSAPPGRPRPRRPSG
jgi:hypothetical protein